MNQVVLYAPCSPMSTRMTLLTTSSEIHDATPEVASAHLRRWIILCEPLYEQLLKTGYSKWAKSFTPTQVSYIFAYLGEP